MTRHDFFGPSAKLDHVGLVVRSIAKISPDEETVSDPIQKVNIAFVNFHDTKVEFLEPHDESSPVWKSLTKGEKLLHLCYEVDDLDEALQRGRQHGFHCIRRPVPAVAFNNRLIAWVYHAEFGLFELLQREKPEQE